MRVFLDSSSLVKRYIFESGTEEVLKISSEADEIIISVICIPEIISALNRIIREGKLSLEDYKKIKIDIFEDIKQATIIQLNENILKESIICLEKCQLRAIDAIHIACALEYKPDLFISSDIRQCTCAKIRNLNVKKI